MPHYLVKGYDYKHDPIMAGWQNSLSMLINATGLVCTIAARNISDDEEVIVVTNWVNVACLNGFIASAGYAACFTALGINDPKTPNAFFTLKPSGSNTLYSSKMTTYTLCFKHPVSLECRDIFNRAHGLKVPRFPQDRFGFRFDTYQAWYSEPRLSVDGELTDTGILIQSWPTSASDPTRDLHTFTSNNTMARKLWQEEVDQMKPLQIEEVTWDFTLAEDEDEDEDEDVKEEENIDEGGA